MKSKIVTFFLFLIMIILIGGFLFVGYAIYNDMFVGDVVQTLHTDENIIALDKENEKTTVKKKSITANCNSSAQWIVINVRK